MNTATLDTLLDRYEEHIDVIYGKQHDELFKWRALKTFQKEWFSKEHSDFLSRFNADDNGDLQLRQRNMDFFLDGMEKLREKYYPASWSFKQDRHSASTFLAMYAPRDNYVYKFSEAETMAVYAEFGLDIGAGGSFQLANYYKCAMKSWSG